MYKILSLFLLLLKYVFSSEFKQKLMDEQPSILTNLVWYFFPLIK